ncbi:SDR family NAD(P)-dependent oxidoreductase [Sporosarcina sp. FSL W7-1349]|uniref:SDR family NAD(P)-dependent oxidoreductase n=1 Tax=Sporosarcina sp. FSL W7-1349 TaxID=2921561 RepID=UPI0030F5427D
MFIVTGASKGIGAALFEQLRAKGNQVIGIARTNPTNAEQFITVDLSKTDQLGDVMKGVIDSYRKQADSFTLINNAGMVEPIGLAGTLDAGVMETALAVNLTAPMILSNSFIAALRSFAGPKRIMNISSGAGRNPYTGWSVYGTTKAGLDQFSRVVALEQEKEKHPVEIVSIAPGIIDTEMQETIRASERKDFPMLDRFIDYKETGALASAEQTAESLLAFLEQENFRAVGPIADIRQFKM